MSRPPYQGAYPGQQGGYPANPPPPYAQQTTYAPPPGPPPPLPNPWSAPHSNQPYASPQQQQPYPQQHQPPTHPPSAAASAAPVQPPQRHGSVQRTAGSYSQQHGAASGGSAAGVGRAGSIKEDQLEFLRSFDTVVIVDDSGSMNVNEQPDGSKGQSRWEEARDALAGLAEIAVRYDPDGIDVHFLNSDQCLISCKSGQEVVRLFDSVQPNGATPTGTKLEMLLLDYMDAIESHKERRRDPAAAAAGPPAPRKRNYLVITDGAATDDPAETIVALARRLDRGNFPLSQVGVQFVQVGNDAEAAQALRELDDELSSQHAGMRDIVDTTAYAGMALSADRLLKALLGGINRRYDRK